MHLLLFAYLLLYLGVPGLNAVEIFTVIYHPSGFRISATHHPDMSSVEFKVNIDRPVNADEQADFQGTITQPTNGEWVVVYPQFTGIAYSYFNALITVRFGNVTIQKMNSIIINSMDAAEISDPDETSSASAYLTLPSGCERSPTTVSGKPVCKGQLIFEDNFNTLDWTKWRREVRISMDADDTGFVSFQRRPKNFYVREGQLHIVPSLLSDVIGEQSIFNGKLDLGEYCTGIVDMSNECSRQGMFSQILPPVVSARVRTRHFFSFRYGKVEVRAKLPKGDWLSPLILLEPLENYYGFSDYASGQMRVVWTPGNILLEDVNGNDISGKRINGGTLLATGQPLRDGLFNGPLLQMHLGDDFHIYTLTWRKDSITLEIDGHKYSVIERDFGQWLGCKKPYAKLWKNGHRMAPFDREFYLTLGVSVGGHSDFPNGCRNGPLRQERPWENGDPKAVLNFFKDRKNWLKTWNGDDAGLHVDYIKVCAL